MQSNQLSLPQRDNAIYRCTSVMTTESIGIMSYYLHSYTFIEMFYKILKECICSLIVDFCLSFDLASGSDIMPHFKRSLHIW